MMRRSLLSHLAAATAFGTVGLVVACSSSGGSNPPIVIPADPNAACDAYFDALFTNAESCAGISVPTDITADERSRFRTLCTQALAYPGQGVSAKTLQDCVAAAGTQCRGANAFASCSAKTGTLPDGAACNSGAQCKGGACSTTTAAVDGGTTTTCGTCQKGIAVGQACGGTNTISCIVGSSCTGNVCVTDGSVDVGGTCTTAITCKVGLACASGKCAALGAHGAKCVANGECQDGLVCLNKACAAGIPLGNDCSVAPTGCLQGVCDPSSKKCATLTLAKPGDPCGVVNKSLVGCAKGACNFVPNTLGGTCPAVVPDGQACPVDATKTCDFLSACVNGVCTFGTPVCK